MLRHRFFLAVDSLAAFPVRFRVTFRRPAVTTINPHEEPLVRPEAFFGGLCEEVVSPGMLIRLPCRCYPLKNSSQHPSCSSALIKNEWCPNSRRPSKRHPWSWSRRFVCFPLVSLRRFGERSGRAGAACGWCRSASFAGWRKSWRGRRHSRKHPILSRSPGLKAPRSPALPEGLGEVGARISTLPRSICASS